MLHPDDRPDSRIWREGLKAFGRADAPRDRWLDVEECRRLVAACEPDFAKLVSAALYTGCRYGELCRALVRDFQPRSSHLAIAASKSGRPRDVVLSDEAAVFFATLVAGRPPMDPLLSRPTRSGTGTRPWSKWHQVEPLKRACRIAGIDPPIHFHALRHSYASLSVQSGMTLIVLAKNLGHTDTRMVERHYGHLSDRFLRAEVEAHTPSLRGPSERR